MFFFFEEPEMNLRGKCSLDDNKNLIIDNIVVIEANQGMTNEGFQMFEGRVAAADIQKYLFEVWEELCDENNEKDKNTFDEDNEEFVGTNEVVPYDPKNVSYQLKFFTLQEIYDMANGYSGTDDVELDLNPDFQRNLVWKGKQKSSLIESILLNIPIPAIYLNEQHDGTYIVADGIQRISAIINFMENNHKLSNMEYLGNLEDCYYRESSYSRKVKDSREGGGIVKRNKFLDAPTMKRFRKYQLTCCVISRDTPELVKIDIFKRLNSGGVSLNNQEIRNAVMSKKLRDELLLICSNKIVDEMITRKVNTNRYVHYELILRYFAFSFYFKNPNINEKLITDINNDLVYSGDTQKYLDDYVNIISKDTSLISASKNLYFDSLEKCKIVFGENSFRKLFENDDGIFKKSPINALLYIVQLHAVSFYSKENLSIIDNFEYREYISELNIFISSATNNSKNIDSAFKLTTEFMYNKFGSRHD